MPTEQGNNLIHEVCRIVSHKTIRHIHIASTDCRERWTTEQPRGDPCVLLLKALVFF